VTARRSSTWTLGTLALASVSLLPCTAHAEERANILERAASAAPVSFDVYLPLQHRDALETLLAAQGDPKSPEYHRWLQLEEVEARFGADPAALAAITRDLTSAGLTVTHPAGQRLHATGSVGAAERALGATLRNATYSNGQTVIAAARCISGPSSMTSAGAVVAGLSTKAPMQSYARRSAFQPDNIYTPTGAYWFDDLKQAYKFPSYLNYTGKGAKIGILMSGGFKAADMDQYFGHEKLKTPSYLVRNIGTGSVYDPKSAGTLESNLDLQQSGGMAPGAVITLYSLPNLLDENILLGLEQILKENAVDVVSMSFGQPELYYTAPYNHGVDYTHMLQVYDDLFAKGNAMGITFVASSGDGGALAAAPVACYTITAGDCGSYVASVSMPAADPHVTAVGGTDLVTTSRPGDRDANYIRESAFADPLGPVEVFKGIYASGGVWGSGGGTSIFFPRPAYQQLVATGNTAKRTVPDVSLHMGGCPVNALHCQPDDSIDLVAVNGSFLGVIGTSASAPAFAGLTALSIERFGTRQGNVNPRLYALAAAQAAGKLKSKVFNDGIQGANGAFHTTPAGYNRVLGNGSVNGAGFLLAPNAPLAGFPETPSNP